MLNINFTPFPALTTDRLVLRRLNIRDANEIMMLRSDKRVNEFIDRPASIKIDESKAFIEKIEKGVVNNEWVYWAITLKGNDNLIGTICLWNISIENATAEIGFELYPGFQGKGIMQDAIAKVINLGFDKMNLDSITAFPKPGNNRSIQVLIKNNFQLDKNHDIGSKRKTN